MQAFGEHLADNYAVSQQELINEWFCSKSNITVLLAQKLGFFQAKFQFDVKGKRFTILSPLYFGHTEL